MKLALKRSIAVVIVFAMIACNASVIEGYINLVVGIGLQVATLAGLPPGAASLVQAAMAAVETDFNNIAAANAAAKPGLVSHLDADLTAAQAQLTSLESAAGIKNPAKINVISASIGIAIVALNELQSLEASIAPSAAVAHASIKRVHQSPAQLKKQFNALVPPENQLK